MFTMENFLNENNLTILDIKSTKRESLFIESKYGIHEVRTCSLKLHGVPTIQTAVNKQQYFENRSKELHGDKYDYSNVKYITSKLPVKIICPIHGEFDQVPSVHLKGSGCRLCGDVRISTSRRNGNCGWGLNDWIKLAKNSSEFSEYKVYIIKCFNCDEEFIKIGRTFKELKNRFCGKAEMPYEYEIITEILDNPYRVFHLETKLKRICKEFKYSVGIPFSGQFECFTPECLSLLKDYIYGNT